MRGTSHPESGDGTAGEVQYSIPRALQEASRTMPPDGARGYHPAIGVSLAASHRWATYRSFASVLNDLMLITHNTSNYFLHDVRNRLTHLSNNPVPFAADRRFPAGELYVCVDRAPVGSMILRINRGVSLDQGSGREYFDAVRDAQEMLAKGDAGSSFPVVFDRGVFESVFQLKWM